MRLIDGEALKEAIKEEQAEGFVEVANVFDCVYDRIDNAPTIDIKDQIAGAYNEGYVCGSRENKRPQGEWILNQDKNPECPFCHHSFTYWGNYCGNCGADMKGGAE